MIKQIKLLNVCERNYLFMCRFKLNLTILNFLIIEVTNYVNIETAQPETQLESYENMFITKTQAF